MARSIHAENHRDDEKTRCGLSKDIPPACSLLRKFYNPKKAVERVGLSDLALLSLPLLAKWSVKPAYRQAGSHEFLNTESLRDEFHGCREMSLERQ
jgi:hypothetical protein